MKTYNQFINEKAGGQAAGKIEVAKTSLKNAEAYVKQVLGDDFEKFNGKFEKHYKFAQTLAKHGKTQRKDMPVITSEDVAKLQKRLKAGAIDVSAPFSDDTNSKNPFPEGLSGAEARKFVNAGLKVHDGKKEDDVVKVSISKVRVGDLKPIQQQIYLDKIVPPIGENGFENSAKFYQSKGTIFIASADNYIIDGHHRFFGACLIDPNMKVHVLKIDLPISKLLPMTLAYGDAIGNKRNL